MARQDNLNVVYKRVPCPSNDGVLLSLDLRGEFTHTQGQLMPVDLNLPVFRLCEETTQTRRQYADSKQISPVLTGISHCETVSNFLQ